jgi:hypothetical protein
MPAKQELVESVKNVQDIAVFFDKLTHAVEPREIRHGANGVAIARKRGLKIPSCLSGYDITYDAKPHKLDERSLKRTIVLELPPKPATSQTIERTISGCWDVGKGPVKSRVCVSCTITWKSISCTITITIKVGF